VIMSLKDTHQVLPSQSLGDLIGVSQELWRMSELFTLAKSRVRIDVPGIFATEHL
jgi:hypothetical protein